ncbi:MAG: hypothetical protein JNL57_06555 [Bacteroidetes bacterium]|nr:hypothetical protein [Bacteroidota bacterium]
MTFRASAVIAFFIFNPAFSQSPATIQWQGKTYLQYPYRMPGSGYTNGAEQYVLNKTSGVNLEIPSYPGKLPDGVYLAYYGDYEYKKGNRVFINNVAATFSLKNNKKEGLARFYTRSMSKKRVQKVYWQGNYEQDLKTGRWFYCTFNKYGYMSDSAEIHYRAGVPDGKCQQWQSDGVLSKTGWIRNGVRDSIWRYYYRKGEQYSEYTYGVNGKNAENWYISKTNRQYRIVYRNTITDSGQQLNAYKVFSHPEGKLLYTAEPVFRGEPMYDSLMACAAVESGYTSTFTGLLFDAPYATSTSSSSYNGELQYLYLWRSPQYPGRWMGTNRNGKVLLPALDITADKTAGYWDNRNRKSDKKRARKPARLQYIVRKLPAGKGGIQSCWEHTAMINGKLFSKYLLVADTSYLYYWTKIYKYNHGWRDMERELENPSENISGYNTETFEPEYYLWRDGKVPHIFTSSITTFNHIKALKSVKRKVIGATGIVEMDSTAEKQLIPVWEGSKIVAFRRIYHYEREGEPTLDWEFRIPFQDWDSLNPVLTENSEIGNELDFNQLQGAEDEKWGGDGRNGDWEWGGGDDEVMTYPDGASPGVKVPNSWGNLNLPRWNGELRVNGAPFTGNLVATVYRTHNKKQWKKTKYARLLNRGYQLQLTMHYLHNDAKEGDHQSLMLNFENGRLQGGGTVYDHFAYGRKKHRRFSDQIRQSGKYDSGERNGLFITKAPANNIVTSRNYVKGSSEGFQHKIQMQVPQTPRNYSESDESYDEQHFTLKNGAREGVCVVGNEKHKLSAVFHKGVPEGDFTIMSRFVYDSEEREYLSPTDYRWLSEIKARFRNGKPDGDWVMWGYNRPRMELRLKEGVFRDTARFYSRGILSHAVIATDKRPYYPAFFDSAYCGLYVNNPEHAIYRDSQAVFVLYTNHEEPWVTCHGQDRMDLDPAQPDFKEHLWPGTHVWYYHNGVVSVTGEVDSTVRTGWWKFYTEAGLLYKEILYKQQKSPFPGDTNLYPGLVRNYSRDGKLLHEGVILDADFSNVCATDADIPELLVGYTHVYDSTGKEILKPNIQVPVTEYQLSGNKLYDGWTRNGVRDSLWRFYTLGGTLEEIGKYSNGQKHGYWLKGSLEGINFQDNACFDKEDSFKRRELMKKLEFTTTFYEKGNRVTENTVKVQAEGFAGNSYGYSKYWKKIKCLGKPKLKKLARKGEDVSFRKGIHLRIPFLSKRRTKYRRLVTPEF